jgi:hypothetical protein
MNSTASTQTLIGLPWVVELELQRRPVLSACQIGSQKKRDKFDKKLHLSFSVQKLIRSAA